jgi:integrase
MSIVRRKRRDGSYAYQVRVSVRGKRLPAKTFDRLSEARARERELQSRSARLVWSRETCGRFAARWLDDYPVVKTGPTRGRRKTSRTLATYVERLKPLIAELGGTPLAEVDRPTARTLAMRYPMTAVTARGMFQDALDDGLIETNPFAKLQLEQRPGRRHHQPLSEREVSELARLAHDVHGPEYGPIFAAHIAFSAYAGVRLEEGLHLEWRDVRLPELEADIRKAKFDKPRTILLVDQATTALREMPRRMGALVFTSKRGRPLTPTSHYAIWNPVRSAFWAGVSEERRAQLVDLDWHSLRHHAGYHFYVRLGFSDELTAAQLGHSDAKLIRELYGHGQANALERMKHHLRGAERFGRQKGAEAQKAAGQ